MSITEQPTLVNERRREWIKNARRDCDWTQRQLADKAGVGVSIVSMIECGHTVSEEAYQKVVRTLDQEFDE